MAGSVGTPKVRPALACSGLVADQESDSNPPSSWLLPVQHVGAQRDDATGTVRVRVGGEWTQDDASPELQRLRQGLAALASQGLPGPGLSVFTTAPGLAHAVSDAAPARYLRAVGKPSLPSPWRFPPAGAGSRRRAWALGSQAPPPLERGA
jgi:hypothetical protein